MTNLVNSLKKYLTNKEFDYVNEILKTSDVKICLIYELSSKKRLF